MDKGCLIFPEQKRKFSIYMWLLLVSSLNIHVIFFSFPDLSNKYTITIIKLQDLSCLSAIRNAQQIVGS